ncbi:MAG: flagellar biosynthesis protein FlgD [Alphaproteobacteria bacterium]|nr:flagellar biosynthesis protein FlgD [Alphaproteobacteria bacterium]
MTTGAAAMPNGVTSATGTSPSQNAGVSFTSTTDAGTLANNFQTFLTLLTTQLQHQNPLDPLDTNQFTAQLVQFASVEQQMKTNTQLGSLISLEQTAQSTAAMAYLGSTATVDGSTTALKSGAATWTFSSDKPASATISIADSSGNVAYQGSYTLQAGQQNFQWDGKGTNGQQWPDGTYKMTITATDTSGNPVNVSTTVSGTVDAVDLTTNPPTLKIGGNSYTADKIKSVVRAGFTGN